jgi:hypothetical protein
MTTHRFAAHTQLQVAFTCARQDLEVRGLSVEPSGLRGLHDQRKVQHG